MPARCPEHAPGVHWPRTLQAPPQRHAGPAPPPTHTRRRRPLATVPSALLPTSFPRCTPPQTPTHKGRKPDSRCWAGSTCVKGRAARPSSAKTRTPARTQPPLLPALSPLAALPPLPDPPPGLAYLRTRRPSAESDDERWVAKGSRSRVSPTPTQWQAAGPEAAAPHLVARRGRGGVGMQGGGGRWPVYRARSSPEPEGAACAGPFGWLSKVEAATCPSSPVWGVYTPRSRRAIRGGAGLPPPHNTTPVSPPTSLPTADTHTHHPLASLHPAPCPGRRVARDY